MNPRATRKGKGKIITTGHPAISKTEVATAAVEVNEKNTRIKTIMWLMNLVATDTLKKATTPT